MANIDGRPDHAAALTTDGVSPKVIVATVVSTLVGAIVALLNGVQADPSLLGELPTFWQSAVLLVIPPAVTFLSAYRANPGNVS